MRDRVAAAQRPGDPEQLVPPAWRLAGRAAEQFRRRAWYEEVFAARRGGDLVVGSDGKIGHAELEIGDAILMLGEDRHAGAKAPGSSIFILVPDADVTVGLAVTSGAELERPVADEPYGRTGVVIDPFRQRRIISTPPPGVSAPS